MVNLKERLLVRRLKRGEPEAFDSLVRTYQSRIYNLCFRFFGNKADAEDVAQEVFCTLFLKIGSFRGDSSLSTWIYRVAVNHCKNRGKYLARRRHESLDQESGVGRARAAVSQAAQPADTLQGEDLKRMVQEEIQALDDEHRIVLILRDLQELSYSEITEVTGLPEGTVKSRLHRARTALKDRLKSRLKGAGRYGS